MSQRSTNLAMTLFPRGAVTMWSAVGGMVPNVAPLNKPQGPLVARRGDWSAGRMMTHEERRAAILTTLGEVELRNLRRTPSLTVDHPPSLTVPRRLHAVIKCDVGDWQVNELEHDSGDPVMLTKRNRGRWRKISKDKRAAVEVDNTQEWHLPHKEFIERVVNYGAYKPLWGRLPVDRPVLKLSLYRESTPWEAVLHRVRHRTGVHRDALHIASPKEGFGCVTQHVSAVGVQSERLLHANRLYNIHNIIFNPLGHGPLSLVSSCAGNRWRVLLRCVEGTIEEIEASVKRIVSQGFINYFPLNDFGITSNSALEIMCAAANQQYFDACRFWLQSEAERSPLLYGHYLKYISADASTAAGILENIKMDAVQFRMGHRYSRFFNSLIELTKDRSVEENAARLWDTVPVSDKLAMLSAPSAFVWNAMASQRLLSCGTRVVPGDLVYCRTSPRGVRVIESDAEALSASIYDVVLPLPGCTAEEAYPPRGPVDQKLYQKLIEEHHLAHAIRAFENCTPNPGGARYRRILVRPADAEWWCIDDPDSLAVLKTDRFLREERRPVGLGFEGDRIRMPTPFNVSDRFREAMEPRIESPHSGKTSLAIAFSLPEGAHPLSLLREGFELRHGYFHDLLSPSPSDGFPPTAFK